MGLSLRIALKIKALCNFCVDPMHCSWDPQVQISANFLLKLSFTILYIHIFKNYFVIVFIVFSFQ